jgi:SWI/SNF-related matrix-associated actin-dependent regulator of chromatin subfamily A3
MTGTPIQNRLEDLGSLIRFLRVPILEEPVTFRKFICSESDISTPTAKKDFSNLRLLLSSICLRRTQAVLEIRSVTETIRPAFSETELIAYKTMEIICKQAIAVAVNSKQAKASHQNILEKILRLREFCNGITVDNADTSEEIFSMMQQTGDTLCAYCTVDIKDPDSIQGERRVRLTKCRRLVCNDEACSLRYQREMSAPGSRCPFCYISHERGNFFGERDEPCAKLKRGQAYPTKLLALLDDVRQQAEGEKW